MTVCVNMHWEGILLTRTRLSVSKLVQYVGVVVLGRNSLDKNEAVGKQAGAVCGCCCVGKEFS